jgi:hypothetical protein
MRKLKSTLIKSLILISVLHSCNNNVNNRDSVNSEKKISPQKDGSYILKLEDAACYSDRGNPSDNTAEWKFVVPEPGRYKVWLSSATRDTINLSYENVVKINLLDNHLEKNPECDKIVRNSGDVSYPYFRTDSYMGSLNFPEAGEYNIQVISEKVITKEIRSQNNINKENTRLMSLMLVPMTR